MKIRIQTAQNVEIEYEIAGVGYRLMAALIDLAVFAGYYAAIWIIAEFLALGFALPDWMIYVFLLPPVPLLLYPLLCEIFMRGQTVGKKAMNLKVVRTDGGEPSIGSYVLRWLFWLLEANPLTAAIGLGAVSVVSIVSTRLGQRVGDIAAGTTVVRLAKDEEETETNASLMTISPEYVPVHPEVARLSSRDIDTIREGYIAVTEGADESLASKIAYRVAEVLEIQRHRIGETTQFLERVLRDWTYYQQGGARMEEKDRDDGNASGEEPQPFDPVY